MGNLDVIRRNSQAVLSRGPAGSTEQWQARSITSRPGVEPRTYGDWANVDGLQTQIRETEVYDQMKQTYKKFMVCSFRVSELVATFIIGDQFQDPKGKYWNLIGQQSAGPGTVAYSIGREVATVAGPDRGGAL